MLLHLYATSAFPDSAKPEADAEAGRANGHARPPATRAFDSSDRTVRDAEEFELEGLMSEEDEPETPKKERA
jgi:hypothetical protein